MTKKSDERILSKDSERVLLLKDELKRTIDRRKKLERMTASGVLSLDAGRDLLLTEIGELEASEIKLLMDLSVLQARRDGIKQAQIESKKERQSIAQNNADPGGRLSPFKKEALAIARNQSEKLKSKSNAERARNVRKILKERHPEIVSEIPDHNTIRKWEIFSD